MSFGNRESRFVHLLCRLLGLLLLAAMLGLSGCGGTVLVALTPKEIAAHGTVEIDAPRATVFEACLQALQDEGYRIDVAEAGVGIVVTWPVRTKADRDLVPGEARFRAYVVLVRDAGNGRARVEAIPSPAEAGASASIQRSTAVTWDADLERAAWERFFRDVRAHLPSERTAFR